MTFDWSVRPGSCTPIVFHITGCTPDTCQLDTVEELIRHADRVFAGLNPALRDEAAQAVAHYFTEELNQ